MNGDTDKAEAQAKVEAHLEGVELALYRRHLERCKKHRADLGAQARAMMSRIERDIVWALEKGNPVWTNPFTNGGHSFDEAIYRVRSDDEVTQHFEDLSALRLAKLQREAVTWLASLFDGASLYLAGRTRPYRPRK